MFIAAICICGIITALFDSLDKYRKGEEITAKSIITSFVGGATGAAFSFCKFPGSEALANYASAAAESFVGEIYDYCAGVKSLTGDNILESMKSVMADTVVNGSISLASDAIFGFRKTSLNIDLNKGFGRVISNVLDGSNRNTMLIYSAKETVEHIFGEVEDLMFEEFLGGLEDILGIDSESSVRNNPIRIFN